MIESSTKSPVSPTSGNLENLSSQLTVILNESQRLMELKAEWGRMPDTPLRKMVFEAIDAYFGKYWPWSKPGNPKEEQSSLSTPSCDPSGLAEICDFLQRRVVTNLSQLVNPRSGDKPGTASEKSVQCRVAPKSGRALAGTDDLPF